MSAEDASLVRAREARASCGRALQLLVHEAATTGTPFVSRDVAERFVDTLVLTILETLAAHDAATEKEPISGNSTRSI